MTKLRLISAALISALLVCAVCVGAGAAISGTGTQADPYKLSSQADLALLSGANYASYAGTGKYFELTNDITMSGDFEPIGTSTYKFNGKFDGKNYVITGLTINNPSTNGQALFSYVTAGALIQNIVFDGASIKGKERTAVLFGTGSGASVSNPATVDNVIVKNSIVDASGHYVGAIAGVGAYNGNAFLSVTDCQARNCIVQTSGYAVGAIAGYGADNGNARAEFVRCSAENCYVQGGNHVGGIAGYGTYGAATVTCQFTDCSVDKCTIRATSNFAGGIYGSYRNNGAQPIVSGCDVSDSSVLAASNAGGVTGGYSAS